MSLLPQSSGRILCLNDGTLFRTTSITAFKLMTCNCWFVGFEKKKTHKKTFLVLLYFNKPTATEHEYAILRPTVELPLLMDHEKFIEISP